MLVYLFELIHNVQVISYSHAGTLPPFYGTLAQHLKSVFKNTTTHVNNKGL